MNPEQTQGLQARSLHQQWIQGNVYELYVPL